jgi:exonuclease SbcD
MRLLHTSDWHVGKTIRGRSRADEFHDVLSELVGIATQERVDAVLVAGDLYEHRTASPEADTLVFETFVRLYEAGIPMVVIPGNHDSPTRLQALTALLRPIRIDAIARVAPPDQGSIVEVPSRDGSEVALVACVPFVPERRFGDAARLFESVESWYQSYAENMGELLAAMAGGFRSDRVNILMSHMFTDGALLGGGEREVNIGIEYAVSPSRLPGTATYLALGHVHKPQAVKGSPSPARYSGSLLQLDFGEVDQAKSVCIVDASPGKPALVREVALHGGRKLMDVSGTLEELAQRKAQFGDAYLRVVVNTGGPVANIVDNVREFLPDAVDVGLDYPRDAVDDQTQDLATLDPLDQYLAYYRLTHGVEARTALAEAFKEVLERERESH